MLPKVQTYSIFPAVVPANKRSLITILSNEKTFIRPDGKTYQFTVIAVDCDDSYYNVQTHTTFDVTANGGVAPAGMTGSKEEELYNKALEVVRLTNRASTSHLQRRMGIGYNHAARLIDLLEDRGIIGPQKTAGARDILVDLNAPVQAAPAPEPTPDPSAPEADFPPQADLQPEYEAFNENGGNQ